MTKKEWNQSFYGDAVFNGFKDLFVVDELRGIRTMRTDVKEFEDKYEFKVDLPGRNKEDIDINYEEGYLTITYQEKKTDEENSNQGKFLYRERFYKSATRSFYLNESINEDEISATFDNGVLTIEVFKAKPTETPKKKIEIK